MLEIIFIWMLCKSMGKLLRRKGRNPLFFQIMVVLAWFMGEFGGAIVAAVVIAIQNGGVEGEIGVAHYLSAIAAALAAVGVVFLIARLLPSAYPEFAQGAGDEFIRPPADPNNPYSP
ncbi:MAG: hypothetical protein R3E01_28240 [Pirellulaceae bacterium]